MKTHRRLLIKGGRVVTADGVLAADVEIENGKISRLGPDLEVEGAETIEAAGRLVAPGGIDPHVHLELLTSSGQVSSDDFSTGSRAALWGGVTTLGDFAYPAPGQRLIDAWEERRALARGKCRTDFFLHAAIMKSPPDLEEQIDECWERGAKSFKVHMNDPTCSEEFLKRVCRHLGRLGAWLLVHAEQGKEINRNRRRLLREGRRSLEYLPRSIPPELEAGAIREVLETAQEHGTKLYIVHLSSRLGLEVVREAKKQGRELAVETCVQYLVLTEEVYRRPDGHYITCVPPFKTEADRQALWEGLADGSIDTVATDHCPFLRSQKDLWGEDFTRLALGIPGVETLVPILWSEGRKRGLSYQRLSELTGTAAARIFGLRPAKGTIKPGADADLFIYDPDYRFKIDWRDLHMNCDFSPYQGLEIEGRPEVTIRGGEIWRG